MSGYCKDCGNTMCLCKELTKENVENGNFTTSMKVWKCPSITRKAKIVKQFIRGEEIPLDSTYMTTIMEPIWGTTDNQWVDVYEVYLHEEVKK